MTNSRAFLPFAPDIGWDPYRGLGDVHLIDQCALLTATDGIGWQHRLLLHAGRRGHGQEPGLRVVSARQGADRVLVGLGRRCRVGLGSREDQRRDRHPCPRWCTNLDRHNDAAVVAGGVVHWLIHCGISSSSSLQEAAGEYILTYDVNAAAVGSVDVPKDRRRPDPQREPAMPSRLASSPDGKLSFVVADHCEVFVWVLSEGGSWARHVQIHMRAERGGPMLQPWIWMDHRVELESFFGDRRSGGVLLRFDGVRFVLDMETGATTCLGGEAGIPYEVDLASRLASMKSF
jgi:hypothetical protein